MISAEDFVHLPFTTDLSEAGIVHMCHSLPRLGGGVRMSGHKLAQEHCGNIGAVGAPPLPGHAGTRLWRQRPVDFRAA